MKLIKKGRDQQGWTKEFDCTGARRGGGGCGAVLLVGELDLEPCRTGVDYLSAGDASVLFRCCECGVKTVVEAPSRVISRVHAPPLTTNIDDDGR